MDLVQNDFVAQVSASGDENVLSAGLSKSEELSDLALRLRLLFENLQGLLAFDGIEDREGFSLLRESNHLVTIHSQTRCEEWQLDLFLRHWRWHDELPKRRQVDQRTVDNCNVSMVFLTSDVVIRHARVVSQVEFKELKITLGEDQSQLHLFHPYQFAKAEIFTISDLGNFDDLFAKPLPVASSVD
jgi:hypothetical protein